MQSKGIVKYVCIPFQWCPENILNLCIKWSAFLQRSVRFGVCSLLFFQMSDIMLVKLMVKMEYINKTYGQNGVYILSENEKIQKDVYESHGDLFQKSNALINGKYRASLMDQKILNIVLSKLEKRQFEDRGESEGLVCTLSAAELKNMLNVEGGSFYTQLKKSAVNLVGYVMGYSDDSLKAFTYLTIVTYASYQDGIFTVIVNGKLREEVNRKTQFTMLDLPTMLAYKSVYALRLHEVLLSKCYRKKRAGVSKYTKKEPDKGKYKIEISVSELKLSLGCINSDEKKVKAILSDSANPDYDAAVEAASEKAFKRFAEFKRKVIDVAVSGINEADNGTTVSYEMNKAGYGGKVYSLTFYVELGAYKNKDKDIKYKNIKDKDVIDGKLIECKDVTDSKCNQEISEEDAFEIYYEVKSLIEEEISLNDIKAICKAADYDMEKIKNAYNIAQGSGNISNLVGFLIKAIKDGYSKPVKKRGRPPKKNTFNNFPQREYTQYDFESIEKEMIKRTSPDN